MRKTEDLIFRYKKEDGEWGYYQPGLSTEPFPKEADSLVVSHKAGMVFEDDIVKITLHSGTSLLYLLWHNREMDKLDVIFLGKNKEKTDLGFNRYDFYCSEARKNNFFLLLQDPYGDVRKIEVIGNLTDNPEVLLPYINKYDVDNFRRRFLAEKESQTTA